MKDVTHASGVIIRDGKILLLLRLPTKKYFPFFWTVPGGKADVDEELSEVVTREVCEETGMHFVLTRHFRDYYLIHDDIHLMGHVFLGTASGEIVVGKDEVETYAWFTYDEAVKLQLAHYVRSLLEDLQKEKLL